MNASDRLPVPRLLILAGAIFVSVSSEFLPTALLPEIAADLNQSESRVGLLVTIFAGTVVLTTAPLAAVTRRFSRKWLMVLTLAVFAVTNILAAIAPSYEVLAATRVLGGLAHGLFWAVTAPYTSLLVRRSQLSRAMSITSAGGSFAFILGVPFAAAIGHALGWRLAFVVMAALVVGFAVLVVIFLPPVSHLVPLTTAEIAVPVRRDRTLPAVLIVAGTVLLVATGHNVFYSYIAPWTIDVGGVPSDLVSLVLLFFGIAGAGGLLIGGLLGDRYPRAVPAVMIVGVIISIALLAGVGRGLAAVIVGMLLWSLSFGGLPALFHTRNMHAASARVRDLASAWVTTAFNLAIGGGALLGGLVLDGWGLEAVPLLGLAIVAVGLVFTLATDRRRIAIHPG